MIDNLPISILVVFALTTLATLCFFYWAMKNSSVATTQKNVLKISLFLILWLLIQAVLTLANVYDADKTIFPPKIFLFGILPTLLLILVLFLSQKGRNFIDTLPLKQLTYLNLVRIPVEFVLWALYLHRAIPQLMTFEGRNFDIIAGITAPFIAYFGLNKMKISRNIVLIWNILCLVLLVNIVVNAFLSVPSPIQQFAFDQPNTAVLNFPFSWLPTFIVPVVLFGHLVSIRQLWNK